MYLWLWGCDHILKQEIVSGNGYPEQNGYLFPKISKSPSTSPYGWWIACTPIVVIREIGNLPVAVSKIDRGRLPIYRNKIDTSRLAIYLTNIQQELSYRKQVVHQLCTQYIVGLYRPKYYTVTLKSRLRVIQDHWKGTILLCVCVTLTITGQPRNSVFIRRV